MEGFSQFFIDLLFCEVIITKHMDWVVIFKNYNQIIGVLSK